MVGSETTSVLASMDLASVPLFLLMGGFAMAGGLAADLYRLAFAFLGHRRGGLCYAVITSCAAFGAICGSSVATTATIGRSTLGEVQSRGYAPKLVAGTIAAGGTLGALIPPSVVLIVYAILTDLSIRDLFIAAVVPGLFAVAMYFLVIAIVVTLRPEQAPRSAPQPWSERRAALIACWRSVLLFGVVLGGLYGGVFTTNEAAAVGAGIAFIFAFASGRMTRKALVEVLTETSANSAMIYLIVIGANLFGYFITVAEFPQALIDAFKNAQISPATLIIMLMLLYLALGCVFDTMAAMVITVPFLSPLVVAAGFDPVWWGIMVLVLVEVGMITPPIGMNVFVLKGVVGPSLSLKDIFKGVMPFIGGDLIRIAILGSFPILTLWLPHMLKR
jgi:tripartite ATP-independent transporter DctM subunit